MSHLIPQNITKLLLDNLIITNEQLLLFKENNQGLSFFNYIIEILKIDQEKIMHVFSKAFNLKEIIVFDENNINIELLAEINIKFLRDNLIIPCKENNNIIMVMADPSNYSFNEIKLIISDFTFAISTKQIILEAINKYYPLEGTEGTKKVIEELEAEEDIGQKIDFNVINEEDISGLAQEAPIIKLVNNILYQAFKKGASDIHIEPFEKELRIRYRVDGSLYTQMTPPKRIQSALISRIKIMSHLNIAEKRQPQDS